MDKYCTSLPAIEVTTWTKKYLFSRRPCRHLEHTKQSRGNDDYVKRWARVPAPQVVRTLLGCIRAQAASGTLVAAMAEDVSLGGATLPHRFLPHRFLPPASQRLPQLVGSDCAAWLLLAPACGTQR